MWSNTKKSTYPTLMLALWLLLGPMVFAEDNGITCHIGSGGEPPQDALEAWRVHWDIYELNPDPIDRIDDDCYLRTDIVATGHRSWVGHSFETVPASLSASIQLGSEAGFSMDSGEQFVVLELSNSTRYQARVLLRYEASGFVAKLNYQDDEGKSSTPASDPISLAREGSVLRLKWTATTPGSDPPDGSVQLFVDDQLVTEVTGLQFVTFLPDKIQYGAIAGVDRYTIGPFRYKPISYETTYFHP